MIPIFEQGNGRGIGFGVDAFTKRFDEICARHLKDKRAASFAFIFYDFHDEATKQILRDLGVFAKLDRLTGKRMSLFYLHASTQEGARAFNEQFLSRLGITGATLPCVAFFEFSNGTIQNLDVACLDQADLVHGFHEIYGVIEERVAQKPRHPVKKTALRWLKVGSRTVAIETLKGAIREGLFHLF